MSGRPLGALAGIDAKIRKMWLAGDSKPAIAAAIGSCVSTVDRRRSAMKLPPRQVAPRDNLWTDEQIAELRRRRALGEQMRQIAPHVGHPEKSIQSKCVELDIRQPEDIPVDRSKKIDRDKLREVWALDLTMEGKAAAMGCSLNVLRREAAICGLVHKQKYRPQAAGIVRKAQNKRQEAKAPPKPKAAPKPRVAIVPPAPKPAPVVAEPGPAAQPIAHPPSMIGAKHPCQWPHGHPGQPGFHFCGAPVARGSYCDQHHRVAYVQPGSPAERKEVRSMEWFGARGKQQGGMEAGAGFVDGALRVAGDA